MILLLADQQSSDTDRNIPRRICDGCWTDVGRMQNGCRFFATLSVGAHVPSTFNILFDIIVRKDRTLWDVCNRNEGDMALYRCTADQNMYSSVVVSER